MICACFVGLLAWVLHSNGGTGNLISSSIVLTKSQKAFRIVQCISGVGGTWGGAGERFSDWSRFEKRKNTAMPAMAVALPITVTITAMFGVFITTATERLNGGTAQWNPLILMISIQQQTYTRISRCATFFAGVAILSSQIFVNITQNTIPYEWILPGCSPDIFPDVRFLSRALIFVNILSFFAHSIYCNFDILIADYWIVRKRMWRVPDLYVENGIYWYKGGWNLRADVALAIGMIPGLPGFFMTVINTSDTSNAGLKIFQIYYFLEFPLGAMSFIVLCYFWPLAGLGEKETMQEEVDNGASVLEGEGIEPIDGKTMAITEKCKT